jgi:hypothetical protein
MIRKPLARASTMIVVVGLDRRNPPLLTHPPIGEWRALDHDGDGKPQSWHGHY